MKTMTSLFQRISMLTIACFTIFTLSIVSQLFAGESYEGYNLFTGMNSKITYLIDSDGNTLRTWTSSYTPALSVYLLEDSTLLRTAKIGSTGGPGASSNFNSGGAGGRVELFSWEGSLLWYYEHRDTTAYCLHHDIELMPNGNILMISWELKSQAECVAAGRNPSTLSASKLWPDYIIEVAPNYDSGSGGTIVWEWHVWDHLIQDYNSAVDNYGTVSEHPEKIDINYYNETTADWNHLNGIDYNAELDQIVLSSRMFSEIWIIDHSTTTEEAATGSGGNCGMGGDLLYRWGNPQVYDRGTSSDQKLFGQHDAEWIGEGLPGYGDILLFNNGDTISYSTVDQLTPPLQGDGTYDIDSSSAYGPTDLTWRYMADTPSDFHSARIAGSQRLPNGNTLICEGNSGYFFEVTTDGETVWYYNYGSDTFRVDRYSLNYAGFIGTELELTCGDLAGDLNDDCYVDMLDVSALAEAWVTSYDIDDLATLAGSWLECTDPYEPCSYGE